MAAYTHCPLESTAAKPSIILLRTFPFLRGLQGKRRADERTRTAYPCSLRVRFHAFTAVSRCFRNRLRKPFSPVVRFWMFPDVRSGYCHGYCQ